MSACMGVTMPTGKPCYAPADYLIDGVGVCTSHLRQQIRWALQRHPKAVLTVRLSHEPAVRVMILVPSPNSERDTEIVDAVVSGTEKMKDLAARFGISRQRVSQIVSRAGVDFHAIREAKREARYAAEDEARTRPCRVCSRLFVRVGHRSTCSEDCALILRDGRRYLEPEWFEYQRRANARSVLAHPERHTAGKLESARRILAGSVPDRRYVLPGSRIAEALRRVGRQDLLPPPAAPRGQASPYRCIAANAKDGLPCKRSVIIEGGLCHIHQGQRDRAEP